MTVQINLPTALHLLEEAVALRGSDYIDEGFREGGCAYIRDETPSCIVAVVLSKAGVPLSTLAKMDHRGSLVVMGREMLANRYDIELDSLAYRVLCRAQARQDEGQTWGTAVHDAKKIPEEVALAMAYSGKEA